MNVFLDSDGVFAAFDEHVFDLFGKYPRDLGDSAMWWHVDQTPHFWDSMPLKTGARDLWEFCLPHSPTILTGCPRTGYDHAAAAKRRWWLTHFGHEQVITCLSRDKATHMISPGDILLDDMPKNLRRWEKAGGVGVYYRNADQAIRDLEAILGSRQ